MRARQTTEKQRERREQWEQFSKVLYSCGSPGSFLFPQAVPALSLAGTGAHLLARSTRANWRCLEFSRHLRVSEPCRKALSVRLYCAGVLSLEQTSEAFARNPQWGHA